MKASKKLLILGGTGEAAELAGRAAAMFAGQLDIVYSLAGRIKPVRGIAVPVRVGGFGGGQGLAQYLADEKTDLLIDATHPFAATISANAYDACLASETPRLALVRPPWHLPSGVKLLEADDINDAVGLLSRFAKRVLVTTGQSGLDGLDKAPDIHFIVRVIEPPSVMPQGGNVTLITGHPPYSLKSELALMEEHAIDALLAKQSGGEGTIAKITAAIRKRITIVLLRRPLPEPGDSVESIEAALKWLAARL